MGLIKILCICFLFLLLIIVLKNINSNLTAYLGVALCVFVMIQIVDKVSVLIGQINLISGAVAIKNEFISIIFKIVGITYGTQFLSEICRDNGQAALSSLLELCGRITITLISFPIFLSLIETVNECIK
ncbi:MAG: SpoIIIAC/SpoIIIAD family protein [Lachnospira sp.]